MLSQIAPVRTRTYYGWSIVGALAVTELISFGVLYYAFSALLVPMQRDLGWSLTVLSGGFSVALLVSGLVAPLVGQWLDRRGARLLMTTGSIIATGAVLAWSRVETIPGYFAVWLAMGLAMAAVFYEPAFAIITAWFIRLRGRALLALTITGGLASTIFLPLTDLLSRSIGWREALVVPGRNPRGWDDRPTPHRPAAPAGGHRPPARRCRCQRRGALWDAAARGIRNGGC